MKDPGENPAANCQSKLVTKSVGLLKECNDFNKLNGNEEIAGNSGLASTLAEKEKIRAKFSRVC